MPTKTTKAIPPLRDGQLLDEDEFERRYHAMPNVNKAELIEGIVYMPSPVRIKSHGTPHGHLVTWMGIYSLHTPGVELVDNGTTRLSPGNRPQPDACLYIEPESGGQARLDPDDYLRGAPEFVAEVAASTTSIDLNDKFIAYRKAGVREYVVWRVRDRAIDWFVRRGTSFSRLAPGADGISRSKILPGLWLDAAALVAGNRRRVHAVLALGLADPTHDAFVARLNPSPRSAE